MGPLLRFGFVALFSTFVACAAPPHAQTPPPSPSDIAELWQEPVDLLQRDLFTGPGGPALTPPADGTYHFVAFKTSGTNPGYDVRDGSGRLWSVKLGVEAQSEVTASRILWAMGFHQPATYYLPHFTLSGVDAGTKLRARFRTDREPWRAGGEWSWYANPFADTQPFRGLIVAQLVLNAWDLKTSNNRIYDAADPRMQPRRHFMVRDVGASLGQARQFALFTLLGTRGLQGTKNNIVDFEQQGFITSVDGNKVTFDYRGRNGVLLNLIKVRDVIWACELLARIPDGHWQAAFRAGHYSAGDSERFIRKIKEKIEQGLALRSTATLTR
jgi:hypothetical protein